MAGESHAGENGEGCRGGGGGGRCRGTSEGLTAQGATCNPGVTGDSHHLGVTLGARGSGDWGLSPPCTEPEPTPSMGIQDGIGRNPLPLGCIWPCPPLILPQTSKCPQGRCPARCSPAAPPSPSLQPLTTSRTRLMPPDIGTVTQQHFPCPASLWDEHTAALGCHPLVPSVPSPPGSGAEQLCSDSRNNTQSIATIPRAGGVMGALGGAQDGNAGGWCWTGTPRAASLATELMH